MRIKLKRAEWLIVGLAAVFFLTLFLPGLDMRRKRHHSCVLCRLTLDNYQASFGRQWSEVTETVCSKWYHKNIKAKHEHYWQSSPSVAYIDFFGITRGVSDSERPAGVLSLTPEQQLGAYQHVPDVHEVQGLFLVMRSDTESDDNARLAKVRAQSQILRDWADSGFTDSWQTIRTKLDSHGTK